MHWIREGTDWVLKSNRRKLVGVANKLIIESNGQFQTETSKGQAEEVRFEQIQNQRRAEAMAQANAGSRA